MNKDLVLQEFMSLEEKERDAIFKLPLESIPSMEARAKLLVILPRVETIRLIEVTLRNWEMFFCLRAIFESDGGKEYFLDLFPGISSKRLASILFSIGSFMDWKDIFNHLPIDTIVGLIDCAVELETKEKNHTHYIFNSIEFLVATEDAIAKKILNRIQPVTFQSMINKNMNLGQEKFFTQVSTLESGRIAELCNLLSLAKAYKVVSVIEDDTKKTKVLQLLSQKFRDHFFTKSNKRHGKESNLNEAEIILKNLPIVSKRRFVEKFPESEQIQGLSIEEKIECFY